MPKRRDFAMLTLSFRSIEKVTVIIICDGLLLAGGVATSRVRSALQRMPTDIPNAAIKAGIRDM